MDLRVPPFSSPHTTLSSVPTGISWSIVASESACFSLYEYRQRIGELPMEVVGVVGNHPREALNISLMGDVPYFHFPITKDTKLERESRIKALVDESGAELDEGPIIHQDVENVSHADSPEDMVRKGRDIERRVLAEAVQLHLQDRVLLNRDRTVVFRT